MRSFWLLRRSFIICLSSLPKLSPQWQREGDPLRGDRKWRREAWFDKQAVAEGRREAAKGGGTGVVHPGTPGYVIYLYFYPSTGLFLYSPCWQHACTSSGCCSSFFLFTYRRNLNVHILQRDNILCNPHDTNSIVQTLPHATTHKPRKAL